MPCDTSEDDAGSPAGLGFVGQFVQRATCEFVLVSVRLVHVEDEEFSGWEHQPLPCRQGGDDLWGVISGSWAYSHFHLPVWKFG